MICLLAQTTQPAPSGGYWMPDSASTIAPTVDGLFYFIFWITAFFFVLVSALMVWFVIRYRFRKGQDAPPMSAAHSTSLELTWTVIPTVIVLMIFYFGFRGFLKMSVLPPNAYEVNVNGQMWKWSFIYPNGHVEPELHIPADTPIRLVLQSQDVIHSLFFPEFREKCDVVPGRYNRFWIQATNPGTYDVYCAEYCGNGHSTMLTKVIVHERSEFAKWMEKAANWENTMTPAEAGKMFYNTRGCTQCHSIDGSRIIGPSLKNVFGTQQPMTGGGSVLADENYIKESIWDPTAKVVAGFEPQMPSYKTTLKEHDIDAIIAFLKSISDQYKNETANLQATSAPATTQPVGNTLHENR